jgi:hypothetical protein
MSTATKNSNSSSSSSSSPAAAGTPGGPRKRGPSHHKPWKAFLTEVDMLTQLPTHVQEDIRNTRSWKGAFLTLFVPVVLAVYAFMLIRTERARPPLQTFTSEPSTLLGRSAVFTVGQGLADAAVRLSLVPSKLDISSPCISKGALIKLEADGARRPLAEASTNLSAPITVPLCPSTDSHYSGGTSEPSSGHGVLIRFPFDCGQSGALDKWPSGVTLSELTRRRANTSLLSIALGSNTASLPMSLVDSRFCTGGYAYMPDKNSVGDNYQSRTNFEGSRVPAVVVELKLKQEIDMDEDNITKVAAVREYIAIQSVTTAPDLTFSPASQISMKDDSTSCTMGRRMTFTCNTNNGTCQNEPYLSDPAYTRTGRLGYLRAACERVCAMAFNAQQSYRQDLSSGAGIAGAPMFRTDRTGMAVPAGSNPAASSSLSWRLVGLNGESFVTTPESPMWTYARYLQAFAVGATSGACAEVAAAAQQVAQYDLCGTTGLESDRFDTVSPEVKFCYSSPIADPSELPSQ